MSIKVSSEFFLLGSAIVLLLSGAYSQESMKPEQEKKKATTDLQVQVTAGDDSLPVTGATVHVEWKEEGELLEKERTTNKQGIAGPFRLPSGEVLIQVIPDNDEWANGGDKYTLKGENQTISIQLKKRKE